MMQKYWLHKGQKISKDMAVCYIFNSSLPVAVLADMQNNIKCYIISEREILIINSKYQIKY